MRILRILSNDVDHAVDSVSTPYSAPGSADDFDALHIFQHDSILERPINPSKQRRIKAPPIDQHQHRLGELVGKSSDPHSPMILIDPAHLNAGNQPQSFRDAGRPGSPDIVLSDDIDRGWRPPDLLWLFGGRCHFDVAKL